MIRDPNAPVIVGAATVQQRFDDPADGLEPLALVRRAFEAAADDAGAPALLGDATMVLLTQGMWTSANPVAVAAPWNPAARSIVADIGVLQQTALSTACSLVASGAARIVLVGGGEAKYRSLRSQITGIAVADTVTVGAPDERLTPAAEIITSEEISRGLPVPARQYALIDTALRRADGQTPAEHRALIDDLQRRFRRVASTNPAAWPAGSAAATVASNPMVAWPYAKLDCSQWNVDQAAGLIVCAAETAQQFGVDRDRWVFAHSGIESNLMVPLSHRAALHRSPAAAIAGDHLRALGVSANDVEHLDLYSCFPAAVRVQAAELEVDLSRQLTVTGGMTFAGGPLNNYTLQALATMVAVLRADPGARGLVTNISGMLTKFGLSLWSTEPPPDGFRSIEITDEARAATATAPFDAGYVGAARVLTYTVAFDRGAPVQGIVLAEIASGARVLASTTDDATIQDMIAAEWCDRPVEVEGPMLTATR